MAWLVLRTSVRVWYCLQVPLLADLSSVAQSLIIDSINYKNFEPEDLIVKEGVSERHSEVVGDTQPYPHTSSLTASNT